jgi:hypothetical protein
MSESGLDLVHGARPGEESTANGNSTCYGAGSRLRTVSTTPVDDMAEPKPDCG